MKIHDVSMTIEEGMAVYPGDPGFGLERVARVEDGDGANLSVLRMGSHTGTHVDPPYHFLPDGMKADALPLDVLIGPVLVVKAGPGEVGRAFIEGLDLAGVARVLFKADGAHLSEGAASCLVEKGVRLVGIDGLSVDAVGGRGAPAHHALLGGGVVIVECLRLGRVRPGTYEMFCLPLKIKDGDGAPARVVLREMA